MDRLDFNLNHANLSYIVHAQMSLIENESKNLQMGFNAFHQKLKEMKVLHIMTSDKRHINKSLCILSVLNM